MPKHYLFVCVLAIVTLLAGCESVPFLQPPPTATPFARFTADDVIAGFSRAGLAVQNVSRDMLIGRDAPNSYSNRYVFEITHIAPLGGQILIFDTPEGMGEWLGYIERLRAGAETRRDVIYVYPYANVLLQVNANLLPSEANQFRAALQGMGGGA